jgi:hypothetical protein
MVSFFQTSPEPLSRTPPPTTLPHLIAPDPTHPERSNPKLSSLPCRPLSPLALLLPSVPRHHLPACRHRRSGHPPYSPPSLRWSGSAISALRCGRPGRAARRGPLPRRDSSRPPRGGEDGAEPGLSSRCRGVPVPIGGEGAARWRAPSRRRYDVTREQPRLADLFSPCFIPLSPLQSHLIVTRQVSERLFYI